jgi:hypothetical protein
MNAEMGPAQVLKAMGVSVLLGSDRSVRDGETPRMLLARAAVAGLRSRAGHRCRVAVQSIEACPEETRLEATAAQAAILDRLLASPDAALIGEWCTLARARGVRVPAVAVPVLLDWWATQPSRSTEVFDATGACGAWLTRLNPDWQRPVALSEIPADADEIWQTGSSAQRVALFETVRNSNPARALAMVRATWDAEGAEVRRRFVEVLGQGASAADEPFLESVLDDRSKVVRREAVCALTRLAGSALRARMRERVAGMIHVEKAKGGPLSRAKLTIKIEPPKSFDKTWERDGLEEQPASGKGKRAFWMVQVLSASDLAVLAERSGLAPADLLSTLEIDAFFEDALKAMLASVAACPDQPDATAWSNAIMASCAHRKCADEEQLASVWAAQSAERSEAMRLGFVSGDNAARGIEVWRLLVSDPRGWSLTYSTRAVKILAESTPKEANTWELWSPIESVSKLLHLGAAELFEGLLEKIFSGRSSDSIRKSLDRVRLRAEMHREFQA